MTRTATATAAPATDDQPRSKGPRTYHIVNPKGAIHACDREHAKWRLGMAGWRLATAGEVEALEAARGLQTADKPICKPWSPDPDAQLAELE